MTKYFHIVQVHPVENGEPNLYKVKAEQEFGIEQEARDFVEFYNALGTDKLKAVYRGRVNDATGELE